MWNDEFLSAEVGQVGTQFDGLGHVDFEPMPGDAVLFRTGWEKYWIVDNARYYAGCPGIGMEVARWLAAGRIGVTGSDTWPNEAIPNPDPACAFCVHTFLQARHGSPIATW